MKFLIGQRVVVGNAIGYIVGPHVVTGEYINPVSGKREKVAPGQFKSGYVWVYSLEKGYASNYDESNVHALPGGQI